MTNIENKTRLNEYGEIIDSGKYEQILSPEDLLKEVSTVNWKEEYGINPTSYQRTYTHIGTKYIPALLNLKDKFLRYFR